MNKLFMLLFFVAVFMLSGCGPLNYAKNRIQNGPPSVLYENAVISITSDNMLLFPQSNNKEFISAVGTRLNELSKAELLKQGGMKEVQSCAPKTMRIAQEITRVQAGSVTDHHGKFIVAQIFTPGSGTSIKNDIFYINTATNIIDCESGKILGTYNHRDDGPNIVDVLQNTALYNIDFAYEFQHGWK